MRVGFFVTCLVDLMRPSIGFAAIKLLEAGGAEVYVPPDADVLRPAGLQLRRPRRCASRSRARSIDEFEGCDYLVAPSGSCSGMIRTHYPDLFADDPAMLARVQALAGAHVRAHRLPRQRAEARRACPGGSRARSRITTRCAGLREMGVKAQPRALLAKVPGLALKEMAEPETCCGFGGTFSIKFGEISARAGRQQVRSTSSARGADAVVLGDLGCMLNIEGRLRRRGDTTTRVLHVAEVLAGRRRRER